MGRLRITQRFPSYLLGAVLVLTSMNAGAQQNAHSLPAESARQVDIESDVAKIRDQLTEVRRDQLNYQIERDLLKETYSSNLQTLNLVLALILGAFAALGYLGLRNLGGLRTEFQADLDKFRTAKSELEQQLRVLVQAQTQATSQVEQLRKENEDQDRRLKGLEVREKATDLMSRSNFALALDYLNVGLQVTPNDSVMISHRFRCLLKLGRVTEAIAAGESILEAQPGDRTPILDLAELYLMAARFEDYERLIATYRDVFTQRSPWMFWYFELLRLLMVKDVPAMKTHLAKLQASASPDKAGKLLDWGFKEVRAMAAGWSDLAAKGLFLLGVEFLAGEIDGKVFAERLGELGR